MTLFAMANGVRAGYSRTFFAIVGGSTAYIFQMVIVALGVGAILQESDILLKTIKCLGAAYLMYMAFKQWRSQEIDLSKVDAYPNPSLWKLYVRGFFVGLSNPKALLVFAVLFPQFIKPSTGETAQFILLGITFLIIQFIGASTYASVGTKVYGWLRAKNLEKYQGKLFALMLVIIGILLLR